MNAVTDKLTTERFPWRFEWHGGRLEQLRELHKEIGEVLTNAGAAE